MPASANLTAIEKTFVGIALLKKKESIPVGSVKEKYYLSVHKKIISSISEMAGNDPVQLAKMIEYLLDEVVHAIGEWQISIPAKDWSAAKRTLHREKVMIKSIGITGFDGLIREIEDDGFAKTESEMTLMFSQLIDLFQNLRDRFKK